MKKLSLHILVLLLSFIIVAACSKSEEGTKSEDQSSTSTTPAERDSKEMTDEGYKRYHVESGIIEYTVDGMQKGTRTVYFDQWGWREAEYSKTEMNMGGMSIKENKLALLDGEWQYHIDLNTRTGTKMQNPFLKQLSDKSGSKDLTEVGMDMMKNMGGKIIGSEMIAGKKCDVWDVKNMNTKSWIWNGVTLKTETKMPGMEQTMIATKFEEDASVDKKYFTIPADVKITEAKGMPDMNKMLEGMKKQKRN